VGIINLNNNKYETDMRPIDENCDCPVCKQYSRAYIRHLIKSKEMLSHRLCVLHNLYFYNKLMADIREALEQDRFAEFKKEKEIIYGTRI
jgi:queuine tRNA-ribosyltransferase